MKASTVEALNTFWMNFYSHVSLKPCSGLPVGGVRETDWRFAEMWFFWLFSYFAGYVAVMFLAFSVGTSCTISACATGSPGPCSMWHVLFGRPC